MDPTTQEIPEVLFLQGKISDGELRAEVAKNHPGIADHISTEAGWDHYKARMFETIARGYLKVLRERRSFSGEIYTIAVGINQSLAEQIRRGGGING